MEPITDSNIQTDLTEVAEVTRYVVPANIFQTWHTKQLPPLMFLAVQNLRKHNPRFKYFLFDDNDCREFIRKNYTADVLNAYDKLIPGAYKADLWRYCVLYKMGGVYLDIKYTPINGFRCIHLLEKEHWTLDYGGKGIYNAVMVCQKGNPILKLAIDQIVENVRTKFRGSCFLEPTGPKLLIKYFNNNDVKQFDLIHDLKGDNDFDKYVMYNGHPILRCYAGYNDERQRYSPKQHYADLWKKGIIYLP